MTLDDLKQRFEAARISFENTGNTFPAGAYARWKRKADCPAQKERNAVIEAAKLYVIARDEGLDAAMIYKLKRA